MNKLKYYRQVYLYLGNDILPTLAEQLGYPIKDNHCFFRVILDYMCDCKWDTVLSKPGYKQLNEDQLEKAINRMYQWMGEPELLIGDNKQSLNYRKRGK